MVAMVILVTSAIDGDDDEDAGDFRDLPVQMAEVVGDSSDGDDNDNAGDIGDINTQW